MEEEEKKEEEEKEAEEKEKEEEEEEEEEKEVEEEEKEVEEEEKEEEEEEEEEEENQEEEEPLSPTGVEGPPKFERGEPLFLLPHSCCQTLRSTVKAISLGGGPVTCVVVIETKSLTSCHPYHNVCTVHWVY